MSKFCWVLVVVLGLASGALAYKFLLRGAVVPASDGRTAILLAPGERDLVLSEMRAFLQSVQEIVAALGEGAMDGVPAVARRVGAAAQHEVPASLVGKLPGEFKLLGFDTHGKFDQLALDAEQLGDAGHTLGQLAELMRNCVACHAAYRIDLETPR
jgi:hypothetical protein